MKYTILLLITLFSFHFASAQTESSNNKEVAEKFMADFNAQEYKSIFNQFAPSMQNFMPFKKTKNFMEGLYTGLGQITDMNFERYEGQSASYKTNFDKGSTWTILMALDKNKEIIGMQVKPYVDLSGPTLERNKTKMQLPFKGEWFVFWGGDTREENYHIDHQAQKNAFDLIIQDKDGKSFKNDGTNNEDYYAFGQELIAPCDAEVVMVVDGIKDNVPGKMNSLFVPGNCVYLKTANNEYLVFAHFKKHSIVVKEGQQVKQGELLGLCGNSGNSSEAHLHFHIQNKEDMNEAVGAKCFFEKVKVNGKLKENYSPVQGDVVEN